MGTTPGVRAMANSSPKMMGFGRRLPERPAADPERDIRLATVDAQQHQRSSGLLASSAAPAESGGALPRPRVLGARTGPTHGVAATSDVLSDSCLLPEPASRCRRDCRGLQQFTGCRRRRIAPSHSKPEGYGPILAGLSRSAAGATFCNATRPALGRRRPERVRGGRRRAGDRRGVRPRDRLGRLRRSAGPDPAHRHPADPRPRLHPWLPRRARLAHPGRREGDLARLEEVVAQGEPPDRVHPGRTGPAGRGNAPSRLPPSNRQRTTPRTNRPRQRDRRIVSPAPAGDRCADRHIADERPLDTSRTLRAANPDPGSPPFRSRCARSRRP